MELAAVEVSRAFPERAIQRIRYAAAKA